MPPSFSHLFPPVATTSISSASHYLVCSLSLLIHWMSFRKITAPWVIIPHKKACCCLFIFSTTKSNGICSPLHPGPLPGLRCKSFVKWPSHYTNRCNWVIGPYCCQKFLYDKVTVPFQWFIVGEERTLNGYTSTQWWSPHRNHPLP